jgi:flagellar protein FlgJ
VIDPFSSSSPPSARPERSRGALAQAPNTRPSTSLGTTEAGRGPNQDKRAQLEKAAKAFEAVFVRQMIGSMRQAKLGEDLFGSQATEQFRELGDARLAEDMADKGGFGIAEMLLQQFEKSGAAE